MAEQVCGGDGIAGGDVLGLTAALVDKSLVVLEPEMLGEARYRMLDTIREYAATRLAASGESAAFQRRLRDYVVRMAEHNLMIGLARVPAPWSARVDVFRRYDVDAGNVSRVLELVPGRRRRRDRPADLHRGQPVLDGAGAPSPKAASGSTRSWPSTRPGWRPGSGERPWWSGRSWPCPAIPPRPRPRPGTG